MSDLITTRELSGVPPTDASVVELKQGIQSWLEPAIKHYKDLAIPMPEPVQKCTDDIKKTYEEYFSKFGITDIQWPQIVYTDKELDIGERESAWGIALPGLVAVSEQGGKHSFVGSLLKAKATVSLKTQENMTFIGSSLSLAHELFHATAPSIVNETIQRAGGLDKVFGKKDQRVITIDRQGLQFQKSKYHKKGYAVEEGLAMLAEHRMKTVIEKHFPSEWTTLSKAAEHAFAEIPDSGFPPESFTVINEVPFAYPASINLVKELLNTVPDFEKLSTRARILHETLPLARAIENVYGPKSYSKIMLATEFTADKILKDIKNVRPVIRFGQAPAPVQQ